MSLISSSERAATTIGLQRNPKQGGGNCNHPISAVYHGGGRQHNLTELFSATAADVCGRAKVEREVHDGS